MEHFAGITQSIFGIGAEMSKDTVNNNEKMEELLAKEIASMSDSEVANNVGKFFGTKMADRSIESLCQEILRLQTLCLAAAEEIRVLDNELEKLSPTSDGTHTSINLLSRLEGRIGGWYDKIWDGESD
jgi:hypothetical protein